MAPFAELAVAIAADARDYYAGLQETVGKTKSWASDITGMAGSALKTGVFAVGGAAVAGVGALAAGFGVAVKDGLALNTTLENVEAQLMAFTKDGAAAEAILADIRAEAAKTPFAFEEMAKATASLLPAAKMSGTELMDLVKQAEILAASNPAEGLEGASFALREALSGDFTSIIERFNLPRQYINQLKEEGVPAMEIVSRAMQQVGFDADLVGNLAETSAGRWSTFWDTIDSLKVTLSQPLFDLIKSGLITVQGLLDANMPQIQAFAQMIGERLAGAIETAVKWVGEVVSSFRGMGDETGGVMATLRDAVVQRFGFVVDWWRENLPLMQQTVETVLGAIRSFWEAHGERIMTIVRGFMAIVQTIFDTYLRNALDVVRAVMQLINGDVEGAGETLKGIAQRTMQAFLEIVATYVGMVRDAFGNVDWGAVGRAIIEGVIAGLRGAGHLLVAAAQGAASGAVQGVKDLLGIRSPSKVMAEEVGTPMIEGLVQGITSNGQNVVSAAQAIIADTLAAMDFATNLDKQFGMFGDVFQGAQLEQYLAGLADRVSGNLSMLDALNLGGGAVDGGNNRGSGEKAGIVINIYTDDARTAGDSVIQSLRAYGLAA